MRRFALRVNGLAGLEQRGRVGGGETGRVPRIGE